MESRNYDCLEKGHVSNETVLPPDSIVRSKNSLIGYENCCDMLVFNQQSNDNQGLLEVGFSETMRNTLSRDSLRNSVGCNGSDVDISNPILVTSDAISGYENVSSISVVDSNSQESSVIDLKLGRIGDNLNFSSFRAASILSSAESSTPAKKGRASSLSSRAGFCQVYGCNKDLSLSKDYHKRHQVCEAHSKTARVIVNAMEQRFCQQCSRFHLLAEFDDGKRSCRKRLAGHNERRRKPQVGLHSGRTGRLLHAYRGSAGSKFQGTTSTATSFICQDISPKSLFQVQKYEKSSWDKQIKLEDGTGCAPKLGNTCRNGQIQQKPVSSRVFDCTSNTSTASVSIENTDQYQVNTGSLSLFQNTFLGNKDLTHLDAASTAQVLNDMPDAGCALSLLSAQSRNSSGHSSGILTDHPIITESPFGVGFLALTSGMSNKCSLYRFGSARRNNLCPMPVLDNDNNINFPYAQEILQGSKFASGRDPLSCEDGSTIDLLQLSSQLQQVENQR